MESPLSMVDAIQKLAKQGIDSEERMLLALAKVGDLTKGCPQCAEAVHKTIVEAFGE